MATPPGPDKDKDVIRNVRLVHEAGAVAKVGVVLCQLYDLGSRSSARKEELQRYLKLACEDSEYGDLYERCLWEFKLDRVSIYNGTAFTETARAYVQGFGRTRNYVGQAAAIWAEEHDLASPELERYREMMRYTLSKEFGQQVKAGFLAALPELEKGLEREPAPKLDTRGKTWADMRDPTFSDRLDRRLSSLELPPFKERPISPSPLPSPPDDFDFGL